MFQWRAFRRFFRTGPGRTGLLLLILGTTGSAVWAECLESRHFTSEGEMATSYIYTPGVWCGGASCPEPSISPDFDGVFWALGASGPGADNCNCNDAYPSDDWVTWFHDGVNFYPAYLFGDWTDFRVDGCIDKAGTFPYTFDFHECMAVLLSDQSDGVGYFAALTELANLNAPPYFVFGEWGAPFVLAPIPVPEIIASWTAGNDVIAQVVVQGPTAGLYLDGGCAPNVISAAQIYMRVVTRPAPPPTDRRADNWDLLTLGPVLLGQVTTLTISCPPNADCYLAAVLVAGDAGRRLDGTSFPTAHVSGNSEPVFLCIDEDDDTYCGNIDDCNDNSDQVHPGATEICNGESEDCDPLIDEDTIDDPFGGDNDDDGWQDVCDNCPLNWNFDQLDSDSDDQGDICDVCPLDPLDDVDQDGHCADVDNCPQTPNPDQLDSDEDDQGDLCDPCPFDPFDDADQDGRCADVDNCPNDWNPGQENQDSDPFGDACDCAPFDGNTYPGAPEVNDGIDNQCPEDPDAGITDETSGDSGFHHPGEIHHYSWPPQEGATLYHAVRTEPWSSCTLVELPVWAWNDDVVPDPGELFYYMNRPAAPFEGSWGESTGDVERFVGGCVPGPDVPANDLCEFAVPVSPGSTVSGTTIDATGPDRQTFSCTTISAPGVWYVVTGGGKYLTASTCDQADYDTKISIFCPGCVHDHYLVVECNDDMPGCANWTSETTWCAEAGRDYLILVHGFLETTGNFDLTVTEGSESCNPDVICPE